MARNYNRLVACVLAGILSATGAFIAWRLLFPPDVAHLALVADRSGSPAFAVCDAVASVVRQDLTMPGAVKESRLTFIATGDANNDFQGLLVEKSALPKKTAAIRSRKKQAEREQAYIEHLVETCKTLKKSDRSPILYAISAAVADLRARGCGGSARCRVDIASDGNENVDQTLAAALNGNERAARKLVPVVDNTGIAVAFCGLAQAPHAAAGKGTQGDAARIERMQKIWSAVFKDPALVVASPFCDDGATPVTTAR